MSKLYLGLALPNAPYAPPSYPVDFRDDFETDGNVNGRTNWTVETLTGFGSQINAITAASGAVGGTTGSAAYGTFAAEPDAWVARVFGANLPAVASTNGAICSHLQVNSGVLSTYQFNHTWLTTSGRDTGRINAGYILSGGSFVTVQQIAGVRALPGDTGAERWRESGANHYVSLYLNGRAIWPELDMTVSGMPYNGKFGLIGNRGASTYLEVSAASDNEGWISVYMPNRIVRVNATGGGDWKIPIAYNGIIGRVDYAIYDASDDSEFVAWTTATIASDVIRFSTASAPASFYVVLRRSLGSGNYTYSRGPVQRVGIVVLGYGQSLESDVNQQTFTTTAAVFANSFRIDGQLSTAEGGVYSAAEATKRRQLPVMSDTVTAHLSKAIGDYASLPVLIVACGESSTSTTDRLPGTSIYNSAVDALAHAGGLISIVSDTSGQNDANLAMSLYKGNQVSIFVDGLRTLNDGELLVMLNPINKSWDGSATSYQNVDRAQWELSQEYPDVFIYGAHVKDLRNLNNLHLGTSTTDTLGSNAVFAARRGGVAALALGYTALDYRGPRMASVTRNSATEVYVLFDLDDFDSLELINTGGGEYHGGLRFTAGTDPASPIWPTGATVDGAPSGGQQGITFTFASGSFPTSVSVWCGYGNNPNNPTNNPTINSTSWATAASTIRGVKSGMASVGVQPYYGASVDYITAT